MKAKKRVAIVDDDDGFRIALERLVRAGGFSPVGYSSAEEFLNDPSHSQIRCIVLDIRLGGMSGFDLQKELSASGFDPPIIFITAHVNSQTSERILQAGCAAYFSKPFAGSPFLEAVRRAVGTADDEPNSNGA